MMKSKVKLDTSREGTRIDNLPKEKCGVLTGAYFTDYYGCWWELTQDEGSTVWMIGDYPEEVMK